MNIKGIFIGFDSFQERGVSAKHIHYVKPDDSYPDISQNSISYWVYNVFFDDTKLFIWKNTKEGEQIQYFLDKGLYLFMKNYLEKLFLKHVELEQMQLFIHRDKKISFEKGRSSIQKQIQDILFT